MPLLFPASSGIAVFSLSATSRSLNITSGDSPNKSSKSFIIIEFPFTLERIIPPITTSATVSSLLVLVVFIWAAFKIALHKSGGNSFIFNGIEFFKIALIVLLFRRLIPLLIPPFRPFSLASLLLRRLAGTKFFSLAMSHTHHHPFCDIKKGPAAVSRLRHVQLSPYSYVFGGKCGIRTHGAFPHH